MSDENPMGHEARIRDHLGEMVRGTVEETLNAMLDAEADQLWCGRYERSQARKDTRAGSVISKREAADHLEPPGKGIRAMTLRYPYEVRKEDEYFSEIPDTEVASEMLKLPTAMFQCQVASRRGRKDFA